MILIAESGSTKTDWVSYSANNNVISEFQTVGINPHILSSQEISKQLFNSDDLKELVSSIKEIHFYGAGCSSVSMKKIVKDALRTLFPTALIHVYHDLDAAVRSTWNGKKAITSILGTGSNCCLFDGNTIIQKKPSLGYLLGDEGSGNNIGGMLYQSIVYNECPMDLEDSFFNTYDFAKVDMVSLLYSKEKPNEFLASFMPFIKANRLNPFIKNLIEKGFRSFVNKHLKEYDHSSSIECHFVGSVAYHFQIELREIIESEGMKMGAVIQSPIHGLVEYHKKYQ